MCRKWLRQPGSCNIGGLADADLCLSLPAVYFCTGCIVVSHGHIDTSRFLIFLVVSGVKRKILRKNF